MNRSFLSTSLLEGALVVRSRTALAMLVISCTGSQWVNAQTPWVAAPATPMQTVVKQPPVSPSPVNRYGVVDLPAPPISLASHAQQNAAQGQPIPSAFRPAPDSTVAPSGSMIPFDLTAPPLMSPTEANAPVSSTAASLVGYKSEPATAAPTAVSLDFRSSQIVAIVGTERILAGDMAAIVEPILHDNKGKLRSKEHEEEVRSTLVRQVLPQYIELKALQQEFFRDMVGNVPPSEIKKAQDQVMKRASRMFFDRFVPMELFKRYEVEDVASLEAKLNETGLSISLVKNHFLTQALASELERKYVLDEYEISPQEILAYYQQNIAEWQIPARARWRQMTVRFDRHPNRQEVDNRIRQMGNEVVLGGKPFEAVARDSSEGFTASDGGLHDWTFAGSLKSTVLDKAIFSLPLNRLSDVIEDETGLHIIEVVEREDARTKDMAEIQSAIRQRISKDMQRQKSEEFRKRVMDRVVVWTRWPEDFPGSRPLEEALGE